MVQEFQLKSTVRSAETPATLRRSGVIPAVIYGDDFENQSLSVNENTFGKVFAQAGESSLINLEIGNNDPVKVLVHDRQIDSVSGKIIHIDFYKVNMKEKIRTEIPLLIVGESPVVLDLEGSLVSNKDAVQVECLPADLVHEIKVDISVLKNFDDVIKISDLRVPEGIEILDDPEEVAILVQPPRSEEEMAELEEKPEEDVAAVKVEGEKPAEGEEAAESSEPIEPEAEVEKTE
ncbi:MAG: 50S ribosomal protein L25 [Candidatus Berkelbacteria bacterium]|nr:50S ribosomal protein L25 [Candidatus Berkelbacteria bacterium]